MAKGGNPGAEKFNRTLETIALTTDGGRFAIIVEPYEASDPEGIDEVEIHLNYDPDNDGLTLGGRWVRDVLSIIADHFEEAGRADLGSRLRALADKLWSEEE